jgi:tetratricopeptide (TPR) repeat protein
MGRIAIIRKDFYRARDELRIVTNDAAAFPDAWLALGFVYRQLERRDEEIETYRAGLLKMRDEEDAIQLYFSLGAAYEQDGEVDSAVAVFEDLLKHHPDHSPSLNYLGYTLADRGERLEHARELIERAVEMQPQNAAYLDSYGWVCYRLGLFDEAIEHLSAAASLDSDPVIYDHLGDAYKAKGDNDKAREWWEKAIEQKPDDKSILIKLGL